MEQKNKPPVADYFTTKKRFCDGREGNNFPDYARLSGDFVLGTAKTFPPMMQVMKEVGGIDFPETLATIAGVEKKEKSEPEA